MRRLLPLGVFLLAVAFWNLVTGVLITSLPPVRQDPALGKTYAPHSTLVQGKEGFARLEMDRYGFNNDASDRGVDVLVLGDSHTEAMQVPRNQNYVHQTQDLLSQSGTPVRLYNAGLSGRSLADYLAYGKGYLDTLQPRVTVVQLSRGDLGGDSLDPSRPVFLRPEGQGWTLATRAETTSALVTLKDTLVASLPLGALAWGQFREGAFDRPWGTRRPFFPEEPPSTQGATPGEAKTGLSGLVDFEVAQLKQVFGPRVILLFLRYGPDLDGQGGIRTASPADGAAWSWLEVAARHHGVALVDAGPRLRQTVSQGQRFPRGFGNSTPDAGHLNEYGHSAVAQALAPVLREALK